MDGADMISDPPENTSSDEDERRDAAATLGDPHVAPCEGPCADDLRSRLERFQQWLGKMLADEPPPEGLPPDLLAQLDQLDADDGECDLYTLAASLTALRGEVGLQGRTFKQLNDSLAPLPAAISTVTQVPVRLDKIQSTQVAAVEHLVEAIETATAPLQKGQSTLPAPGEMLSVMFDLRDRLERGLKTMDEAIDAMRNQAKPGWLARFFGIGKERVDMSGMAQSMREGYQLTLSRVEAALQQWGVKRTESTGAMFDPRLMTAIEVQEVDDAPDGTVLETYRSGHTLNGEVLATAQVKVARKAASAVLKTAGEDTGGTYGD